MADPSKDTIYIDIDDEITSIIDKVQNSKHDIVALVLPKRATMMQSAVNMKLLKRTADESKKKLVLITSEASLLPLAGSVGLYVAKTLQSKPEIPALPDADDTPETLIDQGPAEGEPDVDKKKSVGELAGMAGLAAAAVAAGADDTIDLDNTPKDAATPAKKKKDKSKKRVKIPNFGKFRTKMLLAVAAAVLLVVLWFLGNVVLPKASVKIITDASTVNSTVTFTADTDAKQVDLEKSVVPAQDASVDKTDSATVDATGKKNVGNKATGTMTITNCIDDGKSHTVPSGTSFTSGPYTFVTTEAVTLDPALYSGGNCVSGDFGLSKDADVQASQGGANYNIGERSYNSSINGVTGYGSKMKGGTDKEVTVVSQEDINKAQDQLKNNGNDEAKDELAKQLQDKKLVAIPETLAGGKQTTNNSSNVGDESSTVTVTATTTFSMLGVKEDDLKKLVDNNLKDQVDKSKQTIIDYGFDKATFEEDSKRSPTNQTVTMDTTVAVGAQIDAEALKSEITGKKSGDARNIILARPGVKDVDVSYSPFWISKAPKPSKITITFEQADQNGNGQ